MVLSGCAPLSNTKDSSPGDSPPAPTNTFTISFTGIQALELTVHLIEDMAVSVIVRLADEPAPVWADIKDKVGLLTRNIVANTPKRIFTAKHYGTNDSLKTNIGAMSAADILQPETAYKVYIFSDKSVIETLPFTTAAIPPASAFPSTSIGYSLNFAPNVLPFGAEITLNDYTGVERKGIYEVYGKEGEVLLIPLYMNPIRPLKTGWYFHNGAASLISACTLTHSCLPDPGYTSTSEVVYQSIAGTYYKALWGFQSFNTLTIKDAGYTLVKDGADGQPFVLHLIADK
ncbi:hypothetical protein P0082_09430 [Candidatus Haliotispira prima]|uniref:DUF4382 domain-containing protein n=1 Tax=Candidatus Haliotispira prima TaxID=3034016 RepID=A0ABY8MFC7_9SPIO|nr:hypothetical protein P0082_09430 [Candidatus Haliotispira prima]